MKTIVLSFCSILFWYNISSQVNTDSLLKSKEKIINNRIKNKIIVEEISNSDKQVVEVESAIPAFIGYTQIAGKQNPLELILKPIKVSSMTEFESYFGFPNEDKISLSISENGNGSYTVNLLKLPDLKYILYYSLKMYFANGGKKCYIVSVGTYQNPGFIGLHGNINSNVATGYGLLDGINAIVKEDEPSLIVVPEATKLSVSDYQSLAAEILNQCQNSGDRFAIFDLYEGNQLLNLSALNKNRTYFGSQGLKYGAAYYPFIQTTINYYLNDDESNVDVECNGTTKSLSAYKSADPAIYNFVKNKLKENFVILPPSTSIAGLYVSNDLNKGVWKAPANLTLKNVKSPYIKVDKIMQENLSNDAGGGVSINPIVEFAGKGTLVWGARTLAGNDNEWRYISVRRFFNMVEESIKKSTAWVVFEPNDANTWTKVKATISNYLTQKWKQGALMGSRAEEAFFVKCGLGQTMSNQDVTEGNLNIEIGLAVAKPAEFIISRIRYKMSIN